MIRWVNKGWTFPSNLGSNSFKTLKCIFVCPRSMDCKTNQHCSLGLDCQARFIEQYFASFNWNIWFFINQFEHIFMIKAWGYFFEDKLNNWQLTGLRINTVGTFLNDDKIKSSAKLHLSLGFIWTKIVELVEVQTIELAYSLTQNNLPSTFELCLSWAWQNWKREKCHKVQYKEMCNANLAKLNIAKPYPNPSAGWDVQT